jgi:hypothetical protein
MYTYTYIYIYLEPKDQSSQFLRSGQHIYMYISIYTFIMMKIGEIWILLGHSLICIEKLMNYILNNNNVSNNLMCKGGKWM